MHLFYAYLILVYQSHDISIVPFRAVTRV